MERVNTRRVEVGPNRLEGDLGIPEGARGIVLFAHGSGSSRHSPRNRFVAEVLREAGLATLLIDLLTPDEERMDLITGQLRFDISFLVDRLIEITEWVRENPDTRDLNIGYFGASTGGGAALSAAARRPEIVHAVVSRGGRPDLAELELPRVKAPTLLIVGSQDTLVLALNRDVMDQIGGMHDLAVVEGATHLFEEPGTLEEVSRLARDWFSRYLGQAEVRRAA